MPSATTVLPLMVELLIVPVPARNSAGAGVSGRRGRVIADGRVFERQTGAINATDRHARIPADSRASDQGGPKLKIPPYPP